MHRLQTVQNAAARLVTGTRRRDHITPVLRQLHWLPVRQRVNFKLAVLVFKALHGLAPYYLLNDCQLVTDAGRRQLVRCRYMCASTYHHPLWRSGVRSLRAICLEQSPHWTPPISSLSWTVPPSAKNVFVLTGFLWRLVTFALSAPYKYSYLLTYLLTYLRGIMIRRPPRSTQSRSSAASDVYKRQTGHRNPEARPHHSSPSTALLA